MYGKLFVQMYDSSIVEDPEARFTLMDMVVLSDQNGVVDMTHEALARRTNRPVEIIRSTIARLESPDNRSRNPNMDGVRLAKLDEHRDWGWIILNYDYFRKIASGEQKREKTLERVRRHRETHCNASNAMQKEEVKEQASVEGWEYAPNIYEAYPRKVGRPEGIKAINKALRKIKYEELLERTKQYAQARSGGDPKFTPHPATWFNQERYNDDPETWKDSEGKKIDSNQQRKDDQYQRFLKERAERKAALNG